MDVPWIEKRGPGNDPGPYPEERGRLKTKPRRMTSNSQEGGERTMRGRLPDTHGRRRGSQCHMLPTGRLRWGLRVDPVPDRGEVTVTLRRGLWRNGGKESLQGGAPGGGEERKPRALRRAPGMSVLTPARVHRQVTQTMATSVTDDGCERNQAADRAAFWTVQVGPVQSQDPCGRSTGREHRGEGGARKTRLPAAGLEPRLQRPLGRERPGADLPEASGGMLTADTLISATGNPLWTCELKNSEITNVCCFQSLNVCEFVVI